MVVGGWVDGQMEGDSSAIRCVQSEATFHLSCNGYTSKEKIRRPLSFTL